MGVLGDDGLVLVLCYFKGREARDTGKQSGKEQSRTGQVLRSKSVYRACTEVYVYLARQFRYTKPAAISVVCLALNVELSSQPWSKSEDLKREFSENKTAG